MTTAPPVVLPPPPAATLWTRWWGGVLARRRRRFAARARRLPSPVISIGNLQLGGSGKTPLVAAIAAHLDRGGRRVAILSRGYGRTTRGVRVASRGAGPEGTPAEVGDEPHMLAEVLPGVAVVVGEDRYSAGLYTLEVLTPAPDVFVLDDAFSHLALARDVELLAFPLARPWGNGRLLPFGSLREPIAAARAADAVVLTGAPRPLEGTAAPLAAALAPFGFAGPAFVASEEVAIEPRPTSARVVLATGIAHPERACSSAGAAGLEVVEHLAFADHHRFPRRSIERIERARARAGVETVVVTAKDHAKVEGRIAAPLSVLRVTAVLEPAFWAWLDGALRSPERQSSVPR